MKRRRSALGIPGIPAIILLATAALSAVAGGQGAREPRFRYERTVVTGAAGANHLEPDVALLGAAAPLVYAPGDQAGTLGPLQGGLDDLRLFDAAGREVPYLLVAPPQRRAEWRTGRLLPIAATKTASGFEADFGTATLDRVRITGLPAPFLKRFRLEGGGDRSRYALLVAEGTLFDLPEEGLRRLDVDFPAGDFRYLRLTWDDAASARMPLPSGVAVRLAQPDLHGAPPARVPVRFERRPSEPGKSRFRLRLPAARLPVLALDLEVSGGPGSPLLREATVTEGRLAAGAAGGGEITPVRLGGATLRRAVRGGLAASDLRIPLTLPEGPDLELTVDDGSNPPLPLAGVTAELAPLPWIYFEAAGPGPLTARFGDRDAAAPRYDLEALRGQVARTGTAAARWGELRPRQAPEPGAAASPLPALGAPLDPAKFRHRRPIPASRPGLTALQLDAAVLAGSPELADLRIADAQGRQVPYLRERRDEPLELALPALARQPQPDDPPSLSRYAVELPYPSLPGARLVLATRARVFDRQVELVEEAPVAVHGSQGGTLPAERTVAQSAWRHADPETPAPPLTLDVPTTPATRFDLLVEEGDNAPLPLEPPRLLLPGDRVRFFYPAAHSRLDLLYGQPGLPPPRYDLALLAPRLLGEAATEVAMGPEPRAAPVPDAAARERTIFWGALVAAVLVLLLVLGRLLRGTGGLSS